MNKKFKKRADRADYLNGIDLISYKKICKHLDNGLHYEDIAEEMGIEVRFVLDARDWYEKFKNSQRTEDVRSHKERICPTCKQSIVGL